MQKIIITLIAAMLAWSGSVSAQIVVSTDEFNMYTEYPVALQEDGTLLLQLYPHSFVFIEE